MGPSTHPHALAAAVSHRRAELGIPLAAAEDFGLAKSTITNVERGEQSRMSMTTLAKLDTLLDWPRGTAAHLWRTGERPGHTVAAQTKPAPNTRFEVDDLLDRMSEDDMLLVAQLCRRLVGRTATLDDVRAQLDVLRAEIDAATRQLVS